MTDNRKEILRKIKEDVSLSGFLKKKSKEFAEIENLYDLEVEIGVLKSIIEETKNTDEKLGVAFKKYSGVHVVEKVELAVNSKVVRKVFEKSLEVLEQEYNEGIELLKKSGVKIVNKFVIDKLIDEISELETLIDEYVENAPEIASGFEESLRLKQAWLDEMVGDLK